MLDADSWWVDVVLIITEHVRADSWWMSYWGRLLYNILELIVDGCRTEVDYNRTY